MGPILPVQVEVPQALAAQLQSSGAAVPSAIGGFGLIDTGASLSAVDSGVIQRLGIQAVGVANVGTAGGHQQQALYPARDEFQLSPRGETVRSRVSGLNVPLVALLGRDILRSFVLVYNGPGGGFTLAY
jgi:hypothetical protein